VIKVHPSQLPLDFAEYRPEEMKRRNQEAIMHSIQAGYPMRPEEVAPPPPGVRLSRFVPLWECERCPFDTEDHTLPGSPVLYDDEKHHHYIMLICVKDLKCQSR
jgi:hypothetical protein